MVLLQADALKRLNDDNAAEYVNAAEGAQRWVEVTERIRRRARNASAHPQGLARAR